MKKIIIRPDTGVFVENKEEAQRLRTQIILPALEQGEGIILDFALVNYATQSFVHALIGEALKRYDETALDLLEFKNCSSALQGVIEWVVSYSLDGFPESEPPTMLQPQYAQSSK